MNCVPMYWNWVLDWVTFICVDKKSWDTTGKATGKAPMNWNWELDWVISVRRQNYNRGYQWCTYLLELSIGSGYIHTH